MLPTDPAFFTTLSVPVNANNTLFFTTLNTEVRGNLDPLHIRVFSTESAAHRGINCEIRKRCFRRHEIPHARIRDLRHAKYSRKKFERFQLIDISTV